MSCHAHKGNGKYYIAKNVRFFSGSYLKLNNNDNFVLDIKEVLIILNPISYNY